MKVTTRNFGRSAKLITIENNNQVKISFTNLGARIVDLIVNGRNIVLGFDSADEYLEKDSYPGATIGRTAGRIKDGLINISGKDIQLNQNEFPQTLHGGLGSFDSRLWNFEIFDDGEVAGVHFYLISPDGDNGYPGELKVHVTHSFDEKGQWKIDYQATSNKDTVFNPTGHVYFNLTGDASQAIDDHELFLASSWFVPLKDKSEIVKGNIKSVRGTILDFRNGKKLYQVFESTNEQVRLVAGIDHPFLLDEPGDISVEQARLTLDDISIAVFTDRPSIVIFTANFGDKGVVFRGKSEVHHGAITFETQVPPGSQQIPELGDISLKAGQNYQSTTIYKIINEKK
ncbi:galactose-1-epimerase [Lactovum miscens]|uniref:Aldose 1-epimerase n=1 Tax=Lactovum miscens TaxID=190387 RepID=A0A841C394_9LACT|nr:galactose-1-epimerase [Lactovum miscens]MBB5887303.1 aldose 1-epimerase [Lactovum miscens]